MVVVAGYPSTCALRASPYPAAFRFGVRVHPEGIHPEGHPEPTFNLRMDCFVACAPAMTCIVMSRRLNLNAGGRP
jgi:hypothetical protein